MTASLDQPTLSAWEAARRHGVDMDLLEESMRMTPEERFRAHREALRMVMMLAPKEEDADG